MRSWQWHVQAARLHFLGSIMQPCTRRQEQANSNNECKIDALIGVKFVIWREIAGKAAGRRSRMGSTSTHGKRSSSPHACSAAKIDSLDATTPSTTGGRPSAPVSSARSASRATNYRTCTMPRHLKVIYINTPTSRSALHQPDYIDPNINVKLYDYIKLH
jgi:hypothetical protein